MWVFRFSFLDSVAFNIEFVYSNFVELFMYLFLVSPPSGVICKDFRLRTGSLRTPSRSSVHNWLRQGRAGPLPRPGRSFRTKSRHSISHLLLPHQTGDPLPSVHSGPPWGTEDIGQPSHLHGKGPPPPLGRGPSLSRKRRYVWEVIILELA